MYYLIAAFAAVWATYATLKRARSPQSIIARAEDARAAHETWIARAKRVKQVPDKILTAMYDAIYTFCSKAAKRMDLVLTPFWIKSVLRAKPTQTKYFYTRRNKERKRPIFAVADLTTGDVVAHLARINTLRFRAVGVCTGCGVEMVSRYKRGTFGPFARRLLAYMASSEYELYWACSWCSARAAKQQEKAAS